MNNNFEKAFRRGFTEALMSGIPGGEVSSILICGLRNLKPRIWDSKDGSQKAPPPYEFQVPCTPPCNVWGPERSHLEWEPYGGWSPQTYNRCFLKHPFPPYNAPRSCHMSAQSFFNSGGIRATFDTERPGWLWVPGGDQGAAPAHHECAGGRRLALGFACEASALEAPHVSLTSPKGKKKHERPLFPICRTPFPPYVGN